MGDENDLQSKKPIILIAGTSDARLIIEKLQSEPLLIHATVATELGAEYLRGYPGVVIHQGPLDCRGMVGLMDTVRPFMVIDASHPFAAAASLNAMAACRESGVPYLRFEREETPDIGADLIRVAGFEEAAARAEAVPGNILLTIGSNHLESFTRRVSRFEERLFVRVLPLPQVIAKCGSLGIPTAHILAMQGPCSVALNRALIDHCRAGSLVTKDSGKAGGNREKLAAAGAARIPVIMVNRPGLDYGRVTGAVETIVRVVWEKIKNDN
jgi:precorrin-6A/cobalt-precorrin-6A reductase